MRKHIVMWMGGAALAGAAATGLIGAARPAVSHPPQAGAVTVADDVEGTSSVVAACTVIFTNTPDVTDVESFAPAQQAATDATKAGAAWRPFADHLDAYIARYSAFRDSGWTDGDVEFAQAQDALAADCGAVGVTADEK
ncbi:hypothetical protein AB4Z18_01895 [Leifsonia sp. 2TAF2]|uniref:hypothetical protein n=1 Tax=Leifsonia sp. 2TAF2 TaxID=3233009 RepID=UPI003F9B3A64